MIEKTDIAGTTVQYTYDFLNRVISEKSYDSNGNFLKEHACQYKGKNLISEKDCLGIVTHYQYDCAGRLISKKREEIEERYSYDALGYTAPR